jgi:hydrophobic/amphiphilic exporter-1 (mainly G- bacteria), HAE1 family
LVLAIGLVVDDAIVVVEGVQRHIDEGEAPKDAARKAMDKLSGPVIGVALVLSSVFFPTSFIPGITARLRATDQSVALGFTYRNLPDGRSKLALQSF